MVFPRSHAWTLRQKRFIITAILWGVVLFAVGVYSYERYYRGPDDSIMFGTWRNPITLADEPSYYVFRPNHTFSLFYTSLDGTAVPEVAGRWFAGGKNVYLRYDEPDHSWPLILHIVDVSPNEIQVRLSRENTGEVFRFTRVSDAVTQPHLTNR